jgi:hypothetical protein
MSEQHSTNDSWRSSYEVRSTDLLATASAPDPVQFINQTSNTDDWRTIGINGDWTQTLSYVEYSTPSDARYTNLETTTENPTSSHFIIHTPNSAAVQRHALGRRTQGTQATLFTTTPLPPLPPVPARMETESPTPTLSEEARLAHAAQLKKRRERYAQLKAEKKARRPPTPTIPTVDPYLGRPLERTDVRWTRSQRDARDHAEARGQRILNLTTLTIIHHAVCPRTCHTEWNQEHHILKYLWDFENWVTHMYRDIADDPVLLRGDNPFNAH